MHTPLEARICQLCHQGVESEKTLCLSVLCLYEVIGRYRCLLKQDFGPLCKIMEYEDQWLFPRFGTLHSGLTYVRDFSKTKRTTYLA